MTTTSSDGLPLAAAVDVVVPVWGAPDALARCLASVCAHTDLGAHRLVLSLDGPQSDAVEHVLATPATMAGVVVLRGARRRGYPATVNRALEGSRSDAVLLNSDTVVTARWLEKLRAAAGSAPEVATVTPFSNNATICSLPRFLQNNALPAGYDVDAFARLVDACALRAYPRLPTGVGMCLYVKRVVLDRIGLLDAAAFGRGYGEENDWCMRAARAGYGHVLDDATFVLHEGQRSFGAERARLARAATRVLRRRHPEFFPAVAQFIRDDPLAPLRARVVAALGPPRRVRARPDTILHVVHGWPPYNHAGVEQYAWWLALRQAAERDVAVYARIADGGRATGEALELLDRGGVRVRLVVNDFVDRNPLARSSLGNRVLERDFARYLDEVRPDLVHVHHLAGHCVTLLDVAARRRVPIVHHLHDWWSVCPRANLLDAEVRLCAGPRATKCARCLPFTGLPPAFALNAALHALRRRRVRRSLARAAVLVAGSETIVRSLEGLGALPSGVPVRVVPYGIALPEATTVPAPDAARPPGGPLRVGVIGALMPHKGMHVAAAAFRDVDPRRARLDIWGTAQVFPAYAEEVRRSAGEGPVHLHDRFAESEKRAIFGALDLLLVPSVGLESHGLVADEAMAFGVPVLAARRGALGERLARLGCCALYEPESAAELRAWLDRLVATPEILAEWRRRVPRVRTMDEHASELEAVYELARSRTAA